ncbi:hypothetical protein J8J14_03275 [Roseomonas sp. SSH11]|uniref:Uncharacterized protein n=1 Tax=Pararoseomonas baculiformis TaxID=2820812 RepID=A0ABS4A9V8_9PROT|nr:hypothetical protein [Pararoseomonas baculiformis]MBP0443791.1 hypothetical protein [Pararoseomonas baculiformis]
MDEPRMVTVEVAGKRHVGEYRVEGDLVTVRSEDFGGEESGHAGDDDPHDIARLLLTEMIRRKEDL